MPLCQQACTLYTNLCVLAPYVFVSMQASLNKIAKMWGDTNFVTKPYREMKHVYILGGLDDVFTMLEDNQVLLQTMMGSRFIAGVQVRLGEECGGGHRDGRAVSE